MAQEIAVEKANVSVLPAEQSGGNFLTIIEQHVADPNFTAEKLHSLIDANERILNKQAEIEFNRAMAMLRKELPAVVKNRKNNQTNSDYADLDAIKEVADPLLAKFGFFDRYEDEFLDNGIIRTTCEIVHEMGHSKRNTVQFVLDDKGIKGMVNKTPIHAAASTMTYGQRLSFCRAMGIRISNDDDGNLGGSKLITAQQVDVLRKWIDDTCADIKKFCEHFDIPSITEMAARDYQKATDLLKAKEAQARAKSVKEPVGEDQ